MAKSSPTKKSSRSGKSCITTYVDSELYEELKAQAAAEGRTLSNLLLQILKAKKFTSGD